MAAKVSAVPRLKARPGLLSPCPSCFSAHSVKRRRRGSPPGRQDQRDRQRLQRRHVDGGEQQRELHDGRDRRQHRAGGGGPQQAGRFLHPACHGGDGRRCWRRSPRRSPTAAGRTRAEQAHGDVASGAHRHDQDDDDPDLAQVEHAVGIERIVGQQWQHDQGGGGEDQHVAQLGLVEVRSARSDAGGRAE